MTYKAVVAGKDVHLKCDVCGGSEFVHFKLKVHVETVKGIAYLHQYKCCACNNLKFFNMPLHEIE